MSDQCHRQRLRCADTFGSARGTGGVKAAAFIPLCASTLADRFRDGIARLAWEPGGHEDIHASAWFHHALLGRLGLADVDEDGASRSCLTLAVQADGQRVDTDRIYRNLGANRGEPRNQMLPVEQHEDYRNAVTWTPLQPEVDPDRIGLWGTSYSAGHVLHLGAFDRRAKAVVAQVPVVTALRWLLLSEQIIRVDKWNVCRG